MKFLHVISLSLFISVKSSSARAQDGTFHENAKTINVNSSTATENGTFHENAKRNGNAGLNVVLRNDAKQESQLTRFRRSTSSTQSDKPCYNHYFVGGEPPRGFTNVHPLAEYRYICQGRCSIPDEGNDLQGCFSTLYDLTYKIPIYAAYVLGPNNWVQEHSSSKYWKKDAAGDQNIKDINDKIALMYNDTGYLPCIHKGHLVPAATYSFSFESRRSTFVYTNAVPQYQTFNSGKWSGYERKIRKYGKKWCADEKDIMYLLTGISDCQISGTTKTTKSCVKVAPDRMPKEPKIVIPNSMWTAGCCVKEEKVFSFGVIGNNDPIKDNIHLTEVAVKTLEEIIGIELFPGKNDCNDVNYNVKISTAILT